MGLENFSAALDLLRGYYVNLYVGEDVFKGKLLGVETDHVVLETSDQYIFYYNIDKIQAITKNTKQFQPEASSITYKKTQSLPELLKSFHHSWVTILTIYKQKFSGVLSEIDEDFATLINGEERILIKLTHVSNILKGFYEEEKKPNESKSQDSESNNSKSSDSNSKESKSSDSNSKESKSSDSKSKESKSGDSKSKESKSGDSKSKESKSGDSKSKESKSDDSKSKESKSDDSKSKESKSDDSKSKESKSGDSKSKESKDEKNKNSDTKKKEANTEEETVNSQQPKEYTGEKLTESNTKTGSLWEMLQKLEATTQNHKHPSEVSSQNTKNDQKNQRNDMSNSEKKTEETSKKQHQQLDPKKESISTKITSTTEMTTKNNPVFEMLQKLESITENNQHQAAVSSQNTKEKKTEETSKKQHQQSNSTKDSISTHETKMETKSCSLNKEVKTSVYESYPVVTPEAAPKKTETSNKTETETTNMTYTNDIKSVWKQKDQEQRAFRFTGEPVPRNKERSFPFAGWPSKSKRTFRF